MATALEVKEAVKDRLLEIPGVAGVGVGKKGEDVIIVYVEKPIPDVPEEIGGFPVQVVVSGRFKPLSLVQIPYFPPARALQLERTDKWRPAPGGVSIGHYAITAGTLGSRVFDVATGERLILSNNHVLACSDSEETTRATEGDPIVQPGPYDGGVLPDDQIGELLRWVKLSETGINYVDAGLGKPLADEDLSDEILDIGVVTTWTEAFEDMAVQKSGRTTALTTEAILDVNATIIVDYGVFEATFEDQIITGYMADPGDSGSLLVDMDLNAVGLLFAGSPTVTAHNKITRVMELLGLDFTYAPPGPPRSPTWPWVQLPISAALASVLPLIIE